MIRKEYLRQKSGDSAMGNGCIITSMSPRLHRLDYNGNDVGIAYQNSCIDSWNAAGLRVISINSYEEVKELRKIYKNAEFLVSESAGSLTPGRPLVSIDEMLAVGMSISKNKPFFLVNSDIKFNGSHNNIKCIIDKINDTYVFGSRSESTYSQPSPGLPYSYGFDFFGLDRKSAELVNMTQFAIGTPWWDYILAYSLIAKGIGAIEIESTLFSHLTHEQKWNDRLWEDNLSIAIGILKGLHRKEETAIESIAFYILSSCDKESLPGYLAKESRGYVGVLLGLAMVTYIRQKSYRIKFSSNKKSLVIQTPAHKKNLSRSLSC